MIKHYPSQSYRAVAAFAVAAVLLGVGSASAQTIDTNIFGGTNSPNPDSLSVSGLAAIGAQNTGALGQGFIGNVNLSLGAGTTLTESINAAGNGTFVVSETGVAGVVGGFSATKTFAGATFAANQFYRFTLTRTTASALNLLSSTNVQLTTTSGGTTTTIVDTSTGTGLIGAVNLVNLFSTSNTASFVFQAPANVSTTSPITFTLSGGLTASAINSAFVFTGASLQAVPEPGTWAMLGAAGCGLLAARFRRRA